MRRFLRLWALALLLAFQSLPAQAWIFDSNYQSDLPDANQVNTNTTNFNSNLSSADTDVQKALDTLDNLSVTGAPTSAEYLVSALHASLSAEDLVTEGLAIDYTNGAGTGTFAFDPTELTGDRTWSDGSGASAAWTFNLSGTDPILGAVSGGFDITGSLTTTSTFTSTGLITGNAGLKATNGATSAGFVDIFEDTDDGSNKTRIQTVAMASDITYSLPPDDGDAGEQLQTNGSGVLTWETAGSGTAWDAIGDATADGTIALAGFETDFTSTLDAAGKAVITITNTDADTAADTDFISLAHNDGADANIAYLRAVGDLDGTPQTDYLFTQTAATIRPDLSISGDLTVAGGDILLGSSSIFSGGDTASLNNIDAVDATTETTFEAAIDALANLTTTGTITSGVWNAGAVTSSGTVQGTLIQIDTSTTGVSLDSDGDGMLIEAGTGNGFDEDLRFNYDDGVDGANTVEVTSATGVTQVTYTSIDLKVPTEVYDATGWNGDLTVPTKDAVRDKIETLGTGDITGVGSVSSGEAFTSGTPGASIYFSTGGTIFDANANELIKFPASVASAVNELTISNAATGANPSIAASGGDTNVGIALTTKGSGVVAVTGAVTLNSTLKTTASSLGWSIATTTNQECSTTCTAGCVAGFNDQGSTGGFLACSDNSADSCICAA